MLGSLGGPLNRSLVCMLRYLAWVVPSKSNLLNVARSRRDHPLFHDRPRDSLLGYLDRGKFDCKEMGLAPSTPSW